MFDAMIAAETLPSEDARYAAFARRDKTMRGQGVMAVKTTGVYCRSGCPARPPKRENVAFFRGPEDARATGFRACKRCKPDTPRRLTPPWSRAPVA